MRFSRMIAIGLLLLAAFGVRAAWGLPAAQDAASGYEALRKQAEAFYGDHSYAKANETYKRAAALDLAPAQKRWVDFRIADTAWRAQAGTQTHDSTIYDNAREQLQAIIAQVKRAEDRDLVWAQANESLGDFHWDRSDSQNWGGGWPFYQQALDYWAGSDDIEAARSRYLDMVWKMSQPSWRGEYDFNAYYNNIPIDILDNAVAVATAPADQARAHYLIAVTLMRQGGSWRDVLRTPKEFEAAITVGKSAPWYDDALFAYGQWLAYQGHAKRTESGDWVREQDFSSAVAVFQRILREFKKGESRYYDNARQMIQEITKPVVTVSFSNVFLPGSEIQYSLAWRNVEKIDFKLWRVDLMRDLKLDDDPNGSSDWISRIDTAAAELVKSWDKDTKDAGEHRPGQSAERFDKPLEPGAYVLEAAGGGATSRDVLLISDAAVIMKSVSDQLVAFACNAVNSAPLAKADIKVWKFTHNGDRWVSSSATHAADDSGLARFSGKDFTNPKDSSTTYFAVVNAAGKPAFGLSNGYWPNRPNGGWRIYAFTDRPAYRPKETVEWKITARVEGPTGFSTPADNSLEYEVNDPRGAKISSGVAKLNAFGSAWGSIVLPETLPLGEYRVTYWSDKEHKSQIGAATLFRLEEYKLPEFKVAIKTPEVDGRRKAYVLGDKVQIDIQADYYFGGPVANASVEVIVHQDPYYRWWTWPHEYSWCYPDNNPYRWWGGGGQIVKRETVKTDQTGKARFAFDTPENAGQDFEYRIEARVVDSSRREITATDSVRVTRQRYYVHPHLAHNLHKPGDSVETQFKAMDANDQPVSVEGSVKVTRERWVEIWLDPAGQEVKGEALREMQDRSQMWPPPPPHPESRPWRLKFQGYESEEITTAKVKLDAKGEGSFSFTAQREGYYRIAWTSEDPEAEGPSLPIRADAYAWVATNKSTDLAYRTGGLEIIIDKDTFRSGQSAPVMISSPTNDRWALFTVEGNDLYDVQVIHITGNVKLVQVPIDARHIPNIYLSAAMTHDGQLYQDTKEVIVPPVEQYLKVEVAADRSQYQPGEEGSLTVTTKDADGKPVSAEVAIAMSDEAVSYIQQDYAGDPRPFFFQQRQNAQVQTGSSFQQRAYVKLVKGEKDQLVDERYAVADELEEGDVSRAGQLGQAKMRGMRKSEGRRLRSGGFGGGGGDRDGDQLYALSEAAAAPMAPGSTGGPAGGAAGEKLMRFDAKAADRSIMLGKEVAELKDLENQAERPEGPAVVVRSDFRSTLLWQPAIVTDEGGVAKVSLKYADSLTTWKAVARAAGKGAQFGMASTSTQTKMPLIARLQGPRFFLVGDIVTISGVINNNTDQPLTVTPSLDAQGLTIAALLNKEGQPVKGLGITEIAANSEARIDWQVVVESAGDGLAKIKFTATAGKYADAMEKSFPIHEHGVQRMLVKSGKVRGDDVSFAVDLPSQRKADSTVFAVQVTPSMAVTMLDALPYLIDYPYGCVEQTMSRFLPATITAKTLRDMGLKPEIAMSRVFGGVEPEHADATHPKGKKDLAKLQEITNQSLDRLYDFQHADGGWGWWKEGDSDHFMTAYVLWGLCLAKEAELDVRQDVIDRAAAFLDKEIVEEESSFDRQAWVLHALAQHHALTKGAVSEFQSKALENLWKNRDRLNAYGRALTALAAHNLGDVAKAKTLVENLENGVKRDDRPDTSVIVKGVEGPNDAVIGTAHWGEDGLWWRWSDGNVESTCFALRAILAIDPQNKLVEPVTNWLIKNRRGAQWNNTRDTAIAVLAMNDYLRVSGEMSPEMQYEVFVNGKSIAAKKITTEDALSAPSTFAVDRSILRDGPNDVRIVRTSGKGPIYFSAQASFFSLEEPVPASGNEIFVRRDYYKLVPKPTLLKGYVYDRVPMADGDAVKSGERIEVVMTVEAKNNYEYLLFEDLKPAGLEAVEVRSGMSASAREMKKAGIDRTFGEGKKKRADVMKEQARGDEADYTGRATGVYQELRDRKVALFLSSMPEGVWEIRYSLRAETPGRFHALPVMGGAMYVPEIKCNSEELRIAVTE